MSQRNPMNERYQGEAPKGQTKKSASSMKPKTKAASSVYVRPAEKTPQEKKAIRREQRQKQRELDRTVDALRQRFGKQSVMFANTVRKNEKSKEEKKS